MKWRVRTRKPTKMALNNLARVELSIPAGVNGALVTEVDPTSPAHEAGERTGDGILEINRDPIKNAQDAINDTGKSMGNEPPLKVWRQGGIHYISVPNRMPVS
jgi:serine protease Do